MDDYSTYLDKDKDLTLAYYKKSIIKTEQQKFLETLLPQKDERPLNIADICCGGGTLSYHIKNIYNKSTFHLVDYYDEAIKLAKEINPEENFRFYQDSVYEMPFENEMFDLVFCWQTLLLIEDPVKALDEMLRVTRKNGKLYICSLFNMHFDVDIHAKLIDHTRKSSENNVEVYCNTFSNLTISKWLENKVSHFEIKEFIPENDFFYHGRGMGSNTIMTAFGKRLQVSGGYLMNWGILVIEK